MSTPSLLFIVTLDWQLNIAIFGYRYLTKDFTKRTPSNAKHNSFDLCLNRFSFLLVGEPLFLLGLAPDISHNTIAIMLPNLFFLLASRLPMAARVGLEPTTPRLTAECSAN